MVTNGRLMGTDGRLLSARAVRRGLAINLLAGAIGVPWFVIAMGFPMVLFLERVGADNTLLGLHGLVMQVMMVAQIPATLYVERLPARKPFWAVVTLAYRPLLFVPIVVAWWLGPVPAVAWFTIACVAAMFLLHHAGAPLWLGWMADLVPEEERGRYWGRRHSLCTAANMLMIIAAGPLLDAFPDPRTGGGFTGFALVFGLAAILGTVDIIIHLWVPEPQAAMARSGERMLARIVRPLADRNFRLVTGAFAARALALGIVGPFGIVYLKQVFGVTYTHLTILMVVASLGGISAGMVFGHVMDRIGPRVFGLSVILLCPLAAVPWFLLTGGDRTFLGITLPQVVWCLIPGHLLSGLFIGGAYICQNHLTAALVPHHGRSMAMAVFCTVIGATAGIGIQLGGIISEHVQVGISLPTGQPAHAFHLLIVLYAAVNWLVAVPLLAAVRPADGELPLGTAFRRLFLQNPIRMVSTFWNVYHLSDGYPAERRARAVAELGRQRSAIAVTDLIDQLDDPSGEVREQAALALGAIGSPDAVEVLINRLRDHETDLAPHIVRALRQSADGGVVDGRSVDALVARLEGPDVDTELKREVARTLGAIGDPRAAPTLLAILRDEDNHGVVGASGEALARLGEIAAIYEIVPRMKATRNPVLRRSLAVAVGDLLGGGDGFYPVLSRELATSGSEVAELAERLHRRVERSLPRDLTDHGHNLLERIASIVQRQDAGDHAGAAQILFDVGIGLAAIAYGVRHGGDATTFLDELIWRDERFGVGMWYLDRLRSGWPALGGLAIDGIDVLIGTYFLSTWAQAELGREVPPSRRPLTPPSLPRPSAPA